MSWVYSVYDGPQPESIDEALAAMAAASESSEGAPPTAAIRQFVERFSLDGPTSATRMGSILRGPTAR